MAVGIEPGFNEILAPLLHADRICEVHIPSSLPASERKSCDSAQPNLHTGIGEDEATLKTTLKNSLEPAFMPSHPTKPTQKHPKHAFIPMPLRLGVLKGFLWVRASEDAIGIPLTELGLHS